MEVAKRYGRRRERSRLHGGIQSTKRSEQDPLYGRDTRHAGWGRPERPMARADSFPGTLLAMVLVPRIDPPRHATHKDILDEVPTFR